MSQSERDYCSRCIELGMRLDGRANDDYRPVEVQLGIIAQANGSSRLRLGLTDVIAGVKVEVGRPDSGHPDVGRVHVTVECSSCASPDYEGRGGESWGSQLAHALERSLSPLKPTEGYGIDLGALNIISGKSCWHLYLDALVLNDDGNVLDALSMACYCALGNTKIPRVEIVAGENGEEPEIELDDDMDNSIRINLHSVPVITSVSQVANAYAVDLTLQEEDCSSSTLHVAVGSRGNVCGVTKEGFSSMDPSTMVAMLETAQRTSPKLIRGLLKLLDVT
ncbi:hypothetical protein CEUSTIGMA_g7225.t1 [Chlamydomonas eustigma]|uniref:Ribosomal RNA-processing protein 42 n=1 Tax=Chlamydomonas eustigma TaxID=1157962 RepID=A0A250X9K2_9CHLO|nr:hypothetical protein CEUSTIGMA_g7225.t1 [Chlamydomonas eustigma]|eukprot:GAX79785.1 hypothetical protein CEUSTIGMA_g7225.t1 [Chlamydomonas eustigma]